MRLHASCLHLAVAMCVSALGAAAASAAAADDRTTAVEVRGGTVAFDAATNVSAISIHGKSAALEGRAAIRSTGGGLTLESLSATVPVKTINTGMRLRDEHMRKYVFTTPDGEVPDLTFSAGEARCAGSDTQSTCELAGALAVRGTAKPFAMTLKVTRDAGAFRAVGDAVVKLSAYGIPAPSQLGVKTEDEVKLHLEFVARPTTETIARRGAQ